MSASASPPPRPKLPPVFPGPTGVFKTAKAATPPPDKVQLSTTIRRQRYNPITGGKSRKTKNKKRVTRKRTMQRVKY